MKKIFFASIILVLGFTSCIKEEPLYREADIETFTIEGEGLITSSISENRIQLVISDSANYEELVPVITLSPNATVEPASGVKQDFTNDVVYTVTSEDGNYTKQYTVSVTLSSYKFDFEGWHTEGVGKMAYRALDNLSWSSGNAGVAMAVLLGKADKFPTRDTTDAYSGESAAFMETLAGGKMPIVGLVPIFSGSLFRGEFDLDMNNPAVSTKFGILHPKESGKPTRFTGYYKYLPGKTMIDKDGKEIPGRTDECAIYSVLYKITKGSDDVTGKDEEEDEEENKREFLDGTNILTSDKVVARAVLTDTSKKEIFTRFEIPYVYTEELDYDQYDYKLAVVFASSKDGDKYEGAVGSRLTVDEVEVEREIIKEK